MKRKHKKERKKYKEKIYWLKCFFFSKLKRMYIFVYCRQGIKFQRVLDDNGGRILLHGVHDLNMSSSKVVLPCGQSTVI